MKIIKLVSTMNRESINDPNAEITYFINQGVPEEKKENWFNIKTKGLSHSRNYALSLLNDGEFGIISDNDVYLDSNYRKKISDAFSYYPDADIITFKSKNQDLSDFKKYKSKPFKHNMLTIMKVCSIEIVVKKNKNQVKFDTKFGLGTDIPLGEENIFLSDAIKKNLNIYYYPEYLSVHCDSDHSGNSFSYSKSKARYIVFTRIYGYLSGSMLYVAFILKNISKLLSMHRVLK